MSLMDISKIFSLLQPREEDEEEGERCEALNQAVGGDDAVLLSRLLSQEGYRQCINLSSGWGIPLTPLRAAASRGHLRCLEVLLQHGAEPLENPNETDPPKALTLFPLPKDTADAGVVEIADIPPVQGPAPAIIGSQPAFLRLLRSPHVNRL
ncbi:unnamed protein product [Merluccius merluccius]